jgi:hypothetical protein
MALAISSNPASSNINFVALARNLFKHIQDAEPRSKAKAKRTYHRVPSTSNTMPFNFGSPSGTLSTPTPSGANRLGSLDNLAVILNVLLHCNRGELRNEEGLRVFVRTWQGFMYVLEI